MAATAGVSGARICPNTTITYARSRGYRMPVIKRTSINLELDLVAAAREVLGSNGTTDTIHRALEDVVRREKLRRLAARDFSEYDEAERRLAWGD